MPILILYMNGLTSKACIRYAYLGILLNAVPYEKKSYNLRSIRDELCYMYEHVGTVHVCNI